MRIRHPMALAELQYFWVFSLLLNFPVLLVLSVLLGTGIFSDVHLSEVTF